jgi:hypothetical protein
MASDYEIERILEVVTVTLNDQELEEFDRARVQELVIAAVGVEPKLTVDEGGGLHDTSGVRIGAIRKTPSGEWITERQNPAARGARSEIPAKDEES